MNKLRPVKMYALVLRRELRPILQFSVEMLRRVSEFNTSTIGGIVIIYFIILNETVIAICGSYNRLNNLVFLRIS